MVRPKEHPGGALLPAPTPDGFPTPSCIAARPPNCLADEAQLGCTVRNRIEPQSAKVPSCVVRESACQDGVVVDARRKTGRQLGKRAARVREKNA
jgi:hypothetical protein